MSALRQDRSINALAHFAPQKLALYKLITDQEAREKEKALCEGSLLEFFKRAWREIDSREIAINWHHEVIVNHLEAITFGELRNLVINIPPRHTKTLLANVIWPAWTWARGEKLPLSGPHVKFLCVSYGAELAEEIALKQLRLVTGEWYQLLWGDRVKIYSDQKGRANFGNTRGGERISNSIQGGVLGRGGDVKIVDDPQTRRGADSDVERAESLRGMSDLTTRITDPRIVAQVLIMQRLHEKDATDWALRNWPSDTVHLMFPARFETSRACPQDPRTYDGELLWPAIWTEEELAKIEGGLAGFDDEDGGLSAYAIAGQLQQSPVPRGGSIVGPADWAIYPEEPPDPSAVRRGLRGEVMINLPEVSYIVMALDTAMSERESADWNACVVMGVWHRRRNMVRNVVGTERPWFATRWSAAQDPDEARQQVLEEDDQPRAIMMEAWRRRCKLNDDTLDRLGKPQGLVQRVLDTARRRRVDMIVIENKTRGKDVADELRRQMRSEEFRIFMFEPNRHGDKVARLNSVQPMFSQGLVYAPGNYELVTDASGRQYCEVREELVWVRTVIDEVSRVPRGQHDDLADCVSQSLLYLRENGFLELTKQFIDNAVRDRMWRPKQQQVAEMYGV